MTEDEAKTKQCPGPRAAGLGEDITCIASECMAWRTLPPLFAIWRLKSDGSDAYAFASTSAAGFTDPTRYRIETPDLAQGFCGLAGSPAA